MSTPMKYTLYGETETADGIIPHIAIGNLRCPVMLDIDPKYHGGYGISVNDEGLPIPMRRAGRLVYALPGGRTFVGAADKVEEMA